MIRVAPDLARAAEAIAARGGQLGRPLHLMGETTSTNDEAKHAAKQGAPHGSTWVAESQLAGRGRQGRTWISPPGENLLVSVLLRLTCPAARLPAIPLVAGLAVCDVVRRLAPAAPVGIKWPNDVVLKGDRARVGNRTPLRKIAGILVETSMTGSTVDAVIVGIGLNVHTRVFPEEIADSATSIACIAPSPPDRSEVLAEVLAAFDRDVALVVDRGLGMVHARLAAADALCGSHVRGETGEGIAQGIDGEGRLLVKRDDGVLAAWSAGEVLLT